MGLLRVFRGGLVFCISDTLSGGVCLWLLFFGNRC